MMWHGTKPVFTRDQAPPENGTGYDMVLDEVIRRIKRIEEAIVILSQERNDDDDPDPGGGEPQENDSRVVPGAPMRRVLGHDARWPDDQTERRVSGDSTRDGRRRTVRDAPGNDTPWRETQYVMTLPVDENNGGFIAEQDRSGLHIYRSVRDPKRATSSGPNGLTYGTAMTGDAAAAIARAQLVSINERNRAHYKVR